MTKIHQNREPESGRFAFDGDQDRMCVCGHALGLHIAGGFECGTDPRSVAAGCRCERFRLSRRSPIKAPPRIVTISNPDGRGGELPRGFQQPKGSRS